MADIADIANDLIDAELEATIKARPAAEIPTGTGRCLYCDSELRNTQSRWCDTDCREDWEREQAAEKNRAARSGE